MRKHLEILDRQCAAFVVGMHSAVAPLSLAWMGFQLHSTFDSIKIALHGP